MKDKTKIFYHLIKALLVKEKRDEAINIWIFYLLTFKL